MKNEEIEKKQIKQLCQNQEMEIRNLKGEVILEYIIYSIRILVLVCITWHVRCIFLF